MNVSLSIVWMIFLTISHQTECLRDEKREGSQKTGMLTNTSGNKKHPPLNNEGCNKRVNCKETTDSKDRYGLTEETSYKVTKRPFRNRYTPVYEQSFGVNNAFTNKKSEVAEREFLSKHTSLRRRYYIVRGSRNFKIKTRRTRRVERNTKRRTRRLKAQGAWSRVHTGRNGRALFSKRMGYANSRTYPRGRTMTRMTRTAKSHFSRRMVRSRFHSKKRSYTLKPLHTRRFYSRKTLGEVRTRKSWLYRNAAPNAYLDLRQGPYVRQNKSVEGNGAAIYALISCILIGLSESKWVGSGRSRLTVGPGFVPHTIRFPRYVGGRTFVFVTRRRYRQRPYSGRGPTKRPYTYRTMHTRKFYSRRTGVTVPRRNVVRRTGCTRRRAVRTRRYRRTCRVAFKRSTYTRPTDRCRSRGSYKERREGVQTRGTVGSFYPRGKRSRRSRSVVTGAFHGASNGRSRRAEATRTRKRIVWKSRRSVRKHTRCTATRHTYRRLAGRYLWLHLQHGESVRLPLSRRTAAWKRATSYFRRTGTYATKKGDVKFTRKKFTRDARYLTLKRRFHTKRQGRTVRYYYTLLARYRVRGTYQPRKETKRHFPISTFMRRERRRLLMRWIRHRNRLARPQGIKLVRKGKERLYFHLFD